VLLRHRRQQGIAAHPATPRCPHYKLGRNRSQVGILRTMLLLWYHQVRKTCRRTHNPLGAVKLLISKISAPQGHAMHNPPLPPGSIHQQRNIANLHNRKAIRAAQARLPRLICHSTPFHTQNITPLYT
jgi:hypothetical protein